MSRDRLDAAHGVVIPKDPEGRVGIHAARCVLLHLADMANSDPDDPRCGQAWKSVASIAEYLAMSPSQVRWSLRHLADSGLIEPVGGVSGGRTSTKYQVLPAIPNPPTTQRVETEERHPNPPTTQRVRATSQPTEYSVPNPLSTQCPTHRVLSADQDYQEDQDDVDVVVDQLLDRLADRITDRKAASGGFHSSRTGFRATTRRNLNTERADDAHALVLANPDATVDELLDLLDTDTTQATSSAPSCPHCTGGITHTEELEDEHGQLLIREHFCDDCHEGRTHDRRQAAA